MNTKVCLIAFSLTAMIKYKKLSRIKENHVDEIAKAIFINPIICKKISRGLYATNLSMNTNGIC